MSLRIAATLLESFRLYTGTDWYDERELIAHINGEFVTTPNIELGKAYHALLEKPQRNLEGVYERNGYRFSPDAIEQMLERIDPRGVFEVKTTKPIAGVAEDEQVTLVAKADHLYGLHLSEFKTTVEAFSADKYLDSIQWRVYCWLFGAQKVTYHVACLESDGQLVGLRELHSMDLYPYAQLESDVKALVRELVRYLRIRKLEDFLRKEYPAKAVGQS